MFLVENGADVDEFASKQIWDLGWEYLYVQIVSLIYGPYSSH